MRPATRAAGSVGAGDAGAESSARPSGLWSGVDSGNGSTVLVVSFQSVIHRTAQPCDRMTAIVLTVVRKVTAHNAQSRTSNFT